MEERNDAGNQPDAIVEEKVDGSEFLVVGGQSTRVDYMPDGSVSIHTPETIKEGTHEYEDWKEKASNDKKALESANEKWRSAKDTKKEIEEERRKIQEEREFLIAERARIEYEKKIGIVEKKTDKSQKDIMSFMGLSSRDDFQDILETNPEKVMEAISIIAQQKAEENIKKNTDKKLSEISLMSKAGTDYDAFESWSKTYGVPKNEKTLALFRSNTQKKNTPSQFDNINKIQKNSVNFIRKETPTTTEKDNDNPAKGFFNRNRRS